MNNRHMYDATHENVPALVKMNLSDPAMIAIYLTGTPDIRWVSDDVVKFPHVTRFVRIDQGGETSPQYMADVIDVENRAWTLARAESEIHKFTSPRPTLYVNRSTLPDVTYRGDIWLAAPGLSDAEAVTLARTDKRIVAVQNVFAGDYDRSVVTDPYWPEKAPMVKETVIQIEYYKAGFGWVYPAGGEVRVPATGKVRVRTGAANPEVPPTAVPGTWSDWTEVRVR